MSKLFLIGCTHFGHEKVIDLAGRPFDTVQQMDAAMIENWNKVVSDDDIVYHLGDFAWKEHSAYRRELRGRLVRVQGNHDHAGWWDTPYAETRLADKRKVVMFHYPIQEWDQWHKGAFHFHAHTHKSAFISAERRGNVCVEAINYTPIELNEAIELLNPGTSADFKQASKATANPRVRTDLTELLQRAIKAFNQLTPSEQRAHRDAQRRSWVRGELMMRHPRLKAHEADHLIDSAISDITKSEGE